ncbi:hypothetical protein FA13DRAFT_1795014 [Coprinellus micaceus]|uniref:Uncharacterized protein n=1 Tax=Coprinellus micaceus TaxID=71717 RepID=A0A4Y7SZB1_COPMI|nr:hypothetical protein FA13DRAFT_1795014 [Coprinellus micaceus]
MSQRPPSPLGCNPEVETTRRSPLQNPAPSRNQPTHNTPSHKRRKDRDNLRRDVLRRNAQTSGRQPTNRPHTPTGRSPIIPPQPSPAHVLFFSAGSPPTWIRRLPKARRGGEADTNSNPNKENVVPAPPLPALDTQPNPNEDSVAPAPALPTPAWSLPRKRRRRLLSTV